MKKQWMKIIFVLLFTSTTLVYAQGTFVNYKFDADKTYLIDLKDGTQFIGTILQSDTQLICLKTNSLPKIEIPVDKIKRIAIIQVSKAKDGEYWFANPNATRYLFSPSAFMLKKGEGYYQNTYLFLNSINFGINEHFSIGGGLEFLSTFGTLAGGDFSPIFFITPKFGFEVSEKFHAGGGVLYASTPGFDSEDSRSSMGIVYGIGTIGTEDHNLTGGLGWGFVNGDFSGRPIVTLSGMTRLSKRTALVTENWFIPTDAYYGIFTYGIRFFSEKMMVDLAFLNNPDIAQGLIIGIPYVDFVVKF
ncbi:MAG: hypothetical protein JW857_05135 [Bacteroidales bacterium]|nr:hypothetical protein [Bacteroidales bacterium]